MRFRKLHGAGNDFVLITGIGADPGQDWSDTARRLCARRTGVGADGLVVARLSGIDPAGLDVTCFNADGSTATMCGNALRCTAWSAAADYGLKEMSLTMAGVRHEALVQGSDVQVTAEVGDVALRRVEAVWEGRPFWFDAAHTGTEHVVALVEDVDRIDTEACGRLVRHHPQLAPLGTNVNFVQSAGKQQIKIRTYERGVEAETLSCGSGAVASTVIAIKRGLVADREVIVHNRSGTPLTVRPDLDRPRTYWIGGPVTLVYQGELNSHDDHAPDILRLPDPARVR